MSITISEVWHSANSTKPDRLYNYIVKTFEFCHDNNLLVHSTDNEKAIFNTGLMTTLGEDIYGYFIKQNNPPKNVDNPKKMMFKDFIRASDRRVTNYFSSKPDVANYFSDPMELYYDINKDLDSNLNHIFNDHWDFDVDDDIRYDRFPSELRALGKEVVIALIKDATETARKRVKRNNRLVVPQYYGNQIMYLMPINVSLPGNKVITLALAVEKTQQGSYRVNTIFNLDMAYKKARLVMRPESNWLIQR